MLSNPQALQAVMAYSEVLSKSTFIPKEYQNKPGNVLVAIQWGMEIGLQPLQAMQNIAVINGRPSLWGDASLALVKGSSVCEYVKEEFNQKEMTAICVVKRKGEPEARRSFSQQDAQTAGLWKKQGPWTNYPNRMLQMRARAWALRDNFPDVLKGMAIAEEVADIPQEPTTAIDCNYEEIKDALNSIGGITVKQHDQQMLVEGAQIKHAGILKGLGFVYKNGSWTRTIPTQVETQIPTQVETTEGEEAIQQPSKTSASELLGYLKSKGLEKDQIGIFVKDTLGLTSNDHEGIKKVLNNKPALDEQIAAFCDLQNEADEVF